MIQKRRKGIFLRVMLAALPASLLLSACGGGGSDKEEQAGQEDPLQSYRTQLVDWAPCRDQLAGSGVKEEKILDAALCAKVKVPMDYQDIDAGDVEIAVMRVPARQPEQRRGALFFNPGGPGGDGLMMAGMLHDIFAGSDPDDALGAMQLQLLDEYDMVGFSPRGTGYSTPLVCASDAHPLPVSISAADLVASTDALFENARRKAEACLRNDLARHVSTEYTVQDIDLVRSVLGDEKINYLGYSYGTWLGAWYAARFPERVDRMVLDSVIDFTVNEPGRPEGDLTAGVPVSAPSDRSLARKPNHFNQPKARERWLDEVMGPYAARHHQYFGLSARPDYFREAILAFTPALQVAVAKALSHSSYSNEKADEGVLTLLAARELEALMASHGALTETEFRERLGVHEFAPHNPALSEEVSRIAIALYDEYLSNTHHDAEETILLEPSNATFWAVNCNDVNYSDDVQAWKQFTLDQARQYPVFSPGIGDFLCPFWTGGAHVAPAVERLRGIDFMMVQSEFDNATPHEAAFRMYQAMPAASGVFVATEYTHGVFPYMDRCVDFAVTGYLLGKGASARELNCPAKPLTRDAALAEQASAAGEMMNTRSVPVAAAGSAYLDPLAAQARVDAFKERFVRTFPVPAY